MMNNCGPYDDYPMMPTDDYGMMPRYDMMPKMDEKMMENMMPCLVPCYILPMYPYPECMNEENY